MALALRPRRQRAEPPPASPPAAGAPEVPPQAQPIGELGALRAQRAALLEEAAGVEQRIAAARKEQQTLHGVIYADDADPGDQARAQAEYDALRKIIQRDADRVEAILARTAPLDSQVEQRAAERERLLAMRARDAALLDRKAEMEQDLRPVYETLKAIEQKYRRALPQTADLLQQGALLINKPIAEVDTLRQRLAAIDAELQRLGE